MTGNKRVIKSDLSKVDAHAVHPHEYDEAPELTDEQLGLAEVTVGARPRGRPRATGTKVPVSLRLDSDVLDAYKASGAGWQTRINDDLRQRLYLDAAVPKAVKAQLQGRVRLRPARNPSGKTLVKTLRETYGDQFATGRRGDMTLKSLLKEAGSSSLEDYLRRKQK